MNTTNQQVKTFHNSFRTPYRISYVQAIGKPELQEMRERNWDAICKANRDQSVQSMHDLHSKYWQGMHEADMANDEQEVWTEGKVRARQNLQAVEEWLRKRDELTASNRAYMDEVGEARRSTDMLGGILLITIVISMLILLGVGVGRAF